MQEIVRNLGVLVISSQLLASALLVLGSVVDRSAVEKVTSKSHLAIPGVIKIARLFRASETPALMTIYFLALVFVLFSYAGFILMISLFLTNWLF